MVRVCRGALSKACVRYTNTNLDFLILKNYADFVLKSLIVVSIRAASLYHNLYLRSEFGGKRTNSPPCNIIFQNESFDFEIIIMVNDGDDVRFTMHNIGIWSEFAE